MIHQVTLAPNIETKLTELVTLQLRLLFYALEKGPHLEQAECVAYLRPYYQTRSEQIANWLFVTTSRSRELLTGFAQNEEGKNHWSAEQADRLRAEKRRLLRMMLIDTLRLSRINDSDETKTLSFYMSDDEGLPCTLVTANAFWQSNRRLPAWLTSLRDYFIYFYEALGSGVNKQLFIDGEKLDRQTFFKQFTAANTHHFVCAICDESSFRTISGGHYHSDIEHYFPKSIYPHLACHPYNLIPICKHCNESIHRDIDPLQSSSRRTLGEIFLPYRAGTIGREAALKVEWPSNELYPTAVSLVPQALPSNLLQKIAAFSDIYAIPSRWEGKIDEIGELLWRRIRDFLADDLVVADVLDIETIEKKLNRLLAYMYRDDLGQAPLSFPSLWWLATLIVNEVEGKTADTSPFLQDLQSWVNHDAARQDKLARVAHQLRDVVRALP